MPNINSQGQFTRAMLRVPVPWVFVLSYLFGVALESALRLHGRLSGYAWLVPLGGVVFALGAAVAAWGWLLFHRAGTTRVPGESSTTLVTGGPYRFTRNPMYVGLSLAYLGEAGLLQQFVPVILLPFVILYLNQVVIPLEEERLRAAFGQTYVGYQARVRRWL